MTPPTLLELAQQGDPQAIAALLNRQLQPQGITAKVAIREDSCLHVLLESAAQVPDRQVFLELVRQTLTNLEPESIDRVKVYGRKNGDKEPAWSQEFGLEFGAFSLLVASGAQDVNSPPPTPSPVEGSSNKTVVRKIFVAPIGAIASVLLLVALAFFFYKFISGFNQNFQPAVELNSPTLKPQQ